MDRAEIAFALNNTPNGNYDRCVLFCRKSRQEFEFEIAKCENCKHFFCQFGQRPAERLNLTG